MLAALALLTFTPACFISREKVNTPLDMEKTAKLVPGTSTADDVLEILGAPMDVVQLGRRSAWRYDYSEGKRAGFTIIVLTMINSDIRQDRAWVFFDENDTLTHIGGTYEAKDVEYKLPYQD
jgi:outer membrane protein assembly factor BamE (lipoprotein component of BamABCDE complex)